jgi:chemotaxis protein CheC
LNIATARTAASLSSLTGRRVVLETPHVAVHPIEELAGELATLVQGEIATVHQIFTGPVAGDALLLLNYDAAATLVSLLADEPPRAGRMTESAREALTEIGNILLNACLGVFGDMLQVRVSFSVPALQLDDLTGLLHSLTIGRSGIQYGLVAHTNFHLLDSAIGGYMVMVLGIDSLDRLLEAIERFH